MATVQSLPHVCGKRLTLVQKTPMRSYMVRFGCIGATIFRLRDGQWRWSIALPKVPVSDLRPDGQWGSHWPCRSLEQAAEEVSLVLWAMREAVINGMPRVGKVKQL